MKITVIGFGSLLSERSARLTFPELTGFRLGRVPRYRRVFAHPASIFFLRKIANLETLEISSLSVEYVSEEYPGFVAAIFEVPNDNKILMQDGKMVPSREFLEREEEFEITSVPYVEWDGTKAEGGIICTKSTDEMYLERWGQEHFQKNYRQYGIETIWNWPKDSGMRPCALYLRHCYLAAKSMGEDCFNSFLDETFLIDRTTTIRDYMSQNPHVLDTKAPPELLDRYNG
ncbi:hypothetical protein ACA910_019921 [Epithemia clementina (nom. ined.)]